MAGFAVIVRRDGAPVPVSIVDRMSEGLQHRAPDGIDVTTRGNVAVVFGRLHATPEARSERQPHEGRDGTLLVADARIDNRSQLARRLTWREPLAWTTDLDLIGAAYERRGDAMVDEVLGDFAVVAVHPDGRLTCWRDHLGVKPLYYWVDRDWIVLASEVRQIAAHPEAPRALNVALVGEYLSGRVESATDTAVLGVHRVPAGHVMTIDAAGTRVRRYWKPPFDDPIDLGDQSAYEDEFMAVFAEAVKCRTRTVGPVACELSGGLDSTSVTAAAAALEEGDGTAPGVKAFSCRFPWSRRADEDQYIGEAVASLRLNWAPVVDEASDEPWAWGDAAFSCDIPLPPDGPVHVQLCREARAAGCAVVLTGHGGDHWFDLGPYALLDLVQQRRLRRAWIEAASRTRSRRATAWLLLREGFVPHLPSWMRRPLRRRASHVLGEARALAHLDDRRVPGRQPRAYRSLRAQRLFEVAAGGHLAMSLEVLDRAAARAGVEYRHPYLDRRLVELACRAPIDVHCSPGLNRRLQRGALRDVLPPGIAGRRTKASFSEVWLREFELHLPEREWPDALVVRGGWLEPAPVGAALSDTREAIATRSGAGRVLPLWGFVQGESLARAVGRAAPPRGQ